MADEDGNRKQESLKDRVQSLKRSLEGWREVLLPLNSLLMWERAYDPGILVGTTTLIFLMLWYFEPSVLTTLSILGIIVCVVDYLVPTLSVNFFNPDKWTGIKERKFEDICRGMVKTWDHFHNFHSFVNYFKETKPKIYFVVILALLVLIAWIGNLMDNLLLTYLIVCFSVLLPGLKHHGILNNYLAYCKSAIGSSKKKN